MQLKIEKENRNRQKYILNILLNATIVLLVSGIIIMTYSLIFIKSTNYQSQSISLISLIAILVLLIVLKIIATKNHYRFSAYTLIGALFSLATYISFCWGADSQAGILFYALVIIMSGILIGARFSISSAILTSLSLFIINYLHQQKIIIAERSWIYESWSTSDVTITSIILFIIAVVLWLFNRELSRSEAELENERNLLEIRVEEKTAELKITQAKEIAQVYRFAEFGKLSSGLFHDLVNPLTALMLNINKVKIDSESDPSFNLIKMDINQAIKASEKMKDYIISVRKQINFQNQKELFSLNKEVEEAITILDYKARINQTSIIFIADENIKIQGDPVKFNQIITNLISNAIDSYSNQSDKEIIVKLNKINQEIKLEVTDNGSGISENIIDKIFEPFFSTKNGESLGLGLSFIKKIIEENFSGKIFVISQINYGTTFTVTIPLL